MFFPKWDIVLIQPVEIKPKLVKVLMIKNKGLFSVKTTKLKKSNTMENRKPFSCSGRLNTLVSENQFSLTDLTSGFYPGMVLFIKNKVKTVNSSLNFFATHFCPGKKGFIALYFSYN